MINLQFGKIVEYACTNTVWLKHAVEEFFESGTDLDRLDRTMISGLFNDWVIYDFHPTGSEASPIAQYYLKNPHRLPQIQLETLRQVIATQHYSLYQIEKTKRQEWLDLLDIASGKKYRVYDTKGSSNASQVGCLSARLACVDNKWFIVGSNPLCFPITFTNRALKFHSKNTGKLTPKIIFDNTIKSAKSNVEVLPDKDIPAKRILIEHEFDQVAKKYNVHMTFQEMVAFVYNERYKDHFAQFYKDLMVKKGVCEEMIFENTQLFQDIWNYFPHKVLGGRCPNELYSKQR